MFYLGLIIRLIVWAFGLSFGLLIRLFYLWHKQKAPAWWDLLLAGSLLLIASCFIVFFIKLGK